MSTLHQKEDMTVQGDKGRVDYSYIVFLECALVMVSVAPNIHDFGALSNYKTKPGANGIVSLCTRVK